MKYVCPVCHSVSYNENDARHRYCGRCHQFEDDQPLKSELWFIFSPRKEPWANLRVATFTKAANEWQADIVVIHNETLERMGPRVWDDIKEREEWVKVRKIDVPTAEEVRAAMEGDGERP